MLLKTKICFTGLVLYEIVAVSMLHFQRLCDAMFPTQFCDSWYRYFLFCVIVPLVVLLGLIWVREIIRIRRRKNFIRCAKSTVNNIIQTIREKISEHIDMQDIEKLIAAIILIRIRKYADKHPEIRAKISGMVNTSEDNYAININQEQKKKKTINKKKKTVKNNKK